MASAFFCSAGKRTFSGSGVLFDEADILQNDAFSYTDEKYHYYKIQ